MQRRGVTLVELLVVIAIITLLIALAVPAIQRVRAAMDRVRCGNNLHQLGIALHHYHTDYKKFPAGITTAKPGEPHAWMTFLTRTLPYLEQQRIWSDALDHYKIEPYPFINPPHSGFSTPVKYFTCPSDYRLSRAQPTHNNRVAALSSYVGVAGTDYRHRDGMLFADSETTLNNIPDGATHTLLVGERPPSTDFWFGWWYASVGQANSGTPDILLGVRELNIPRPFTYFCAPGPFRYEPGQLGNQCDAFHFWSLHTGGSQFLFADGSVRFLGYTADRVMPALATRSGGEAVGDDWD